MIWCSCSFLIDALHYAFPNKLMMLIRAALIRRPLFWSKIDWLAPFPFSFHSVVSLQIFSFYYCFLMYNSSVQCWIICLCLFVCYDGLVCFKNYLQSFFFFFFNVSSPLISTIFHLSIQTLSILLYLWSVSVFFHSASNQGLWQSKMDFVACVCSVWFELDSVFCRYLNLFSLNQWTHNTINDDDCIFFDL